MASRTGVSRSRMQWQSDNHIICDIWHQVYFSHWGEVFDVLAILYSPSLVVDIWYAESPTLNSVPSALSPVSEIGHDRICPHSCLATSLSQLSLHVAQSDFTHMAIQRLTCSTCSADQCPCCSIKSRMPPATVGNDDFKLHASIVKDRKWLKPVVAVNVVTQAPITFSVFLSAICLRSALSD